jgi:hypothetical protein
MKKLLCAFSLLTVLLFPVFAGACMIQYAVTVTANDGTGDVTKIFSGNAETDENGYFESLLVDSDQAIGSAVIEGLTLKLNADPEVGIEFGVRSGSLATTFNIMSDVVTFPPLANSVGYASAGITLTDRAVLGAAITGLFDGGKVYQARYNGTSVFANLVSGFGITGGTLTTSEAKPGIGSELITDTLLGIESEFSFTLSARDSASGTSTFVVTPIPEPATIAMLGFGALSLIRRRK